LIRHELLLCHCILINLMRNNHMKDNVELNSKLLIASFQKAVYLNQTIHANNYYERLYDCFFSRKHSTGLFFSSLLSYETTIKKLLLQSVCFTRMGGQVVEVVKRNNHSGSYIFKWCSVQISCFI